MGKEKNIDREILKYMKKKEMVSTRELAVSLGFAWHSVNTHCLKLQIKGVVEGFKLGNVNVWKLKKS